MQAIQPSDICAICMDETNRDFLYKTCCTLLLCRKCYNQLEVESFPNHSTCPGCRKCFNQVGYSIDLVNNKVVPRAYCGLPLPSIQSLKEHDEHVLSCVECLKKVIKGNSWFEKQLTEKFAGIKRKLQTVEDEVFVRNRVIRDLSSQNAFLAREVARQAETLERFSGVIIPRALSPMSLSSTSSFSATDMLSSSSSSSEDEEENTASENTQAAPTTQTPITQTPPILRTPPTSSERTSAPVLQRRRVHVPFQVPVQEEAEGTIQLSRSRRVLQFTVDSIE